MADSIRPQHPPHWILFDAVGTLIDPQPSAGEVYYRAAARYGSRLPRDEIIRRFHAVFRTLERTEIDDSSAWQDPAKLTTSEDNERRRWRRIVTEVIDDIQTPQECFDELFSHFARASSWKCFPDVQQTLARLAQRGFRLAVGSNYDDRLNTLCDQLPELRPIELRFISSRLGYRKPSAYFYRAVIEQTGSPSENILMVGDDYTNDILGATAAGLRTCLLDRRGKHHNRDDNVPVIDGLTALADDLIPGCIV